MGSAGPTGLLSPTRRAAQAAQTQDSPCIIHAVSKRGERREGKEKLGETAGGRGGGGGGSTNSGPHGKETSGRKTK